MMLMSLILQVEMPHGHSVPMKIGDAQSLFWDIVFILQRPIDVRSAFQGTWGSSASHSSYSPSAPASRAGVRSVIGSLLIARRGAGGGGGAGRGDGGTAGARGRGQAPARRRRDGEAVREGVELLARGHDVVAVRAALGREIGRASCRERV